MDEKKTTRSQILKEADTIINGKREIDYGSVEDNFARIANLWSTYLSEVNGMIIEVTPKEVADLMILLKMARIMNSGTRDSYVDIAGYSAIAGELSE